MIRLIKLQIKNKIWFWEKSNVTVYKYGNTGNMPEKMCIIVTKIYFMRWRTEECLFFYTMRYAFE